MATGNVSAIYLASVPSRLKFVVPAVLCMRMAAAQDPVPLSIPDLGGAMAHVLLQDQLGALWIGTDRGLLRFDGAATERYVSEPMEADALPHDNILDLLLAADGTLWVATSSGTWTVHTRSGVRHHIRFLHQGGPQDLEPLHLAASADGHWAFCGGAGLFKWTPGDSVYRHVASRGEPSLVRAGGGWEAPDRSLWYVDRMAVRHWMPDTGNEEVFPCKPFGSEAPPKTLMLDLQPDLFNKDLLWIATWGLGPVSFNMRTHQYQPYTIDPPLDDLHNVVRSAMQVDSARWYVAMDEHLYTLNVGAPRDALVPVNVDGLVRSVLRTPDGRSYFGGFGTLWVEHSGPATIHPLAGELRFSNTHAIGARDGDGFWAVRFYADRRLMRLEKDGRLRYDIPLPSFSAPYEAFRLAQDRNGDVWLGTTRGLMRCAAGSRTIEEVPLSIGELNGSRAAVTDLLIDHADRLWMVIDERHLVRFDPRHNEQLHTGSKELPGTALLVGLAEFDSAHMILGRRDAPPLLVERNTLRIRPMVEQGVADAAFASVEGVVMQQDGKPLLYAYNYGLTRLHDPDGDGDWTIDRTWRPAERPGFGHAVCDLRGRIWLATDRGGYLLDPHNDVLSTLDPAHGVNSSLMGHMTLLPDGGVLACGTPQLLFTKEHEQALAEAPLLWRQVLVGGADRTDAAVEGRTIELGPGNGGLAIRFGRIALLEGNAFRYAYRLVRNSTPGPWVDLGQQRTLSLAELEAGDHVLELRSEGPSAPPATIGLRLQVLPAWWATWWFRAVALAFAMAVGILGTRQVLALRYRRKVRELERQRELERVRMRIARDVHDGIGSGLTKITMMLRNVPGADPAHAQRIAKASSELVHELGEIVWTVDPRNDDVASFIAFVRSTLGRQAEDLPMQLTSALTCDPSVAEKALPPDVKRNVLLVMREAVNNALKHSGGDHIVVEMDIDAQRLKLSVADNGHGFDRDHPREGGNGLHNFRKRAEELGGTQTVHSTPEGTTISLVVPLTSTNMGMRG